MLEEAAGTPCWAGLLDGPIALLACLLGSGPDYSLTLHREPLKTPQVWIRCSHRAKLLLQLSCFKSPFISAASNVKSYVNQVKMVSIFDSALWFI